MQDSLRSTVDFIKSRTTLLFGGDKSPQTAQTDMSAQSYDGETIRIGYMVKRSQMKRRLTYENFKSRWFVLTNKLLRYHDGTLESGAAREKGRIYLSTVKAVEDVDEGVLSKPFPFQVVYSESNTKEMITLYIHAVHNDERTEWIELLRQACKQNKAIFNAKYHTGIWLLRERRYSCCDSIEKNGVGCKAVSFTTEDPPSPIVNRKSDTPPPLPIQTEPEPVAGNFGMILKQVIALYDYEGAEDDDLSLTKGEEYDVVSNNGPHWWRARNKRGECGFIPANYVQVVTEEGLEKYEWFYPNISRAQAEGILRRESKEGCFLIRDSSQLGMYSLSLFSKDMNPQGVVRHYHVKQTVDGQVYFSDKHPFQTLPELITYHKYNCAGLLVRLRCPPSNRISSQPATPGLGHDIWEIDRHELNFGKELGKGQFGAVYKATWRNQTEVAVKMMHEGTMQEDDFLDEAKTMKSLQHRHLVQLYGVCSTTRPICLVMEYMSHGALLYYLRRHQAKLMRLPGTLLDTCVQVCYGMEYLEEKGFIHRDLAARNCLVGDNNCVKVADFGLTRFVLDDDYTSSAGAKFPIKWAPPEVLSYSRFSSKSDVWAYGVLMWEVFSGGEMPYGRMRNHEVVEKVVAAKQRLDKPHACPREIFDLMYSCWAELPEDRPPFRDLCPRLETMQETGLYP